MQTNDASIEYSTMTSAVVQAVKGELTSVNKWVSAGDYVLAFWGTKESLEEQKAQFITDAIIPGLDKKHAAALAKELPRKNGKEYTAMDSNGRDAWETANQAKKDARATAHTMYARVIKYAFTTDTDTDDQVTTSLKTKIQEAIANLIKKCEKAESADFDLVATLAALNNVLTVVNK